MTLLFEAVYYLEVKTKSPSLQFICQLDQGKTSEFDFGKPLRG